MKKAVGYIRAGAGDVERQRAEIEAYCLKGDMEIVGWKECAGFDEVAYGNWMGRRRIDAVVAASNVDVTENVYEFYAYRCKMRMRNSDLYVAKWKDYPGYVLHRKVFEGFMDVLVRKELESEPVRSATGRIRKANRGGYIGGRAPMGYRVEDGRLTVNPDEVPAVLFIMEEKHRGGTKLGTVEKLNAQGYKTRKGGPFQISTVQGIWNNEQFYRGYYKVKGSGEWVKGQHEAILKDE